MLHSAAETGNMDGLNEEQVRLVVSCLDYLAPFEQAADEIHKELRVKIRYDD